MKKARLMALAVGLCMWGLDGGRSGLAQPRNPDGLAVIVGNRNYEHKDVFQVTYAHRDAEAFRRYVIDALGFDERNVLLLPDAKRSDLLRMFGKPGNDRSQLWARLTPEREWDVIIYYSGHGVPGLDDGKAYLLPTDVTPDSAREDGYPLELLYQKLGALENTRSVRVYLDACFSGSSDAGPLIRSASPVFTLPEAPEVPAKVTVLSAAENSQVASWDRQAGHGLFTHHLLDALYGRGDTDQDGKVTADEAKAYLDDYMSRAALRLHNRTQDAVLSRAANSPVVLAAAPKGGFPDRPDLGPVQEPQPGGVDTGTAKATSPAGKFKIEELDETRWTSKRSNIRSGPGVSYDKVGRLDTGTEVAVTGKVAGTPWMRIALKDGKAAYVHESLLRPERLPEKVEKTTARSPQWTPVNKTMVAKRRIALRRGPDLTAGLAGYVESGQKVDVLARMADWYQIGRKTELAYASADSLRDLRCRMVDRMKKVRRVIDTYSPYAIEIIEYSDRDCSRCVRNVKSGFRAEISDYKEECNDKGGVLEDMPDEFKLYTDPYGDSGCGCTINSEDGASYNVEIELECVAYDNAKTGQQVKVCE